MSHTKAPSRNQAIDAFRGITIAGMVLVNLPGSWSHLHPPLAHAQWHGWTPTDFVFPFFLFAIGLSMAFSFARRQEKLQKPAASEDTASNAPLWPHILRRSGIIIGLGLLLNAFPKFDLAHLRIPGVLQRIGLAYLFAAILCQRLSWKWILGLTTGILLLYWCLMTGVYVPGYGVGQLTTEGNLGAYVDRLFLDGHLYRKMWDPEGLLGTLPSIASITAGVLVGLWLQQPHDKRDLAGWLFVGGWGLILLGLLWGAWFPINKKLWTSSYVVFSTGAAMQVLGGCYWLLEIKGWRRLFQPALVFGSNAIALFVMHILYIKVIRILIRFPLAEKKTISLYHWMYTHGFASWAGPLNGSLFFAIAHVVMWYFVMLYFYRKGWFLKI